MFIEFSRLFVARCVKSSSFLVFLSGLEAFVGSKWPRKCKILVFLWARSVNSSSFLVFLSALEAFVGSKGPS